MNLKQVAELAGVSPSTVSRVLNGRAYVNEETRERVLRVVRETNYHQNALAQSLKFGRSNMICLMIPSIENQIFSKITRGVEDTAQINGYTVILCNTDENALLEEAYIETMKKHWIDGFIVCSLFGDAPHIRELRKQGYPIVLVNRFEPQDIGNIDIVSSDNFQIGYDATNYIIRTGHKRIAIAQGRDEIFFYRERLRGYKQALADNKIEYREELVMRETSGANDFNFRMKELMRIEMPPDAVFCTSDPKAFIVMHALHDAGFRIPEDVTVVGVDDVNMSAMVEPPLTTVSQHLYERGATAAKDLMRQIRFKQTYGRLPKPEHIICGSDLIVRRSSK